MAFVLGRVEGRGVEQAGVGVGDGRAFSGVSCYLVNGRLRSAGVRSFDASQVAGRFVRFFLVLSQKEKNKEAEEVVFFFPWGLFLFVASGSVF